MQQQAITKDNINHLIDEILEDAKKAGATSAEVDVAIETGFSATARMGESETLEYNHDNDITITVYDGYKSGSVSTSDTRSSALKEAVEAALRIARYAEDDPASGIATAEQMAKKVIPLETYFPWNISAEDAMQMASECDQLGLDADKRIQNSEGSTVSTHDSLIAYGNSNGFNHHYQSTRHSISSILVAQESDEMVRDYYYYSARAADDLPNIKQIANRAVKNTVGRLNAQKISTGKYPVLFVPEIARSFLSHFVSAIAGHALYKKSSFLLDKLDAQIFPDWFSLQELPHLPRGMGSVPFDDNGLLTYEKYFIEQGVLKNYALGIYGARKLNMQSTANAGGVHNLVATQQDKDFIALLKELDKGVVITEVVGQGVNMVTGDYSRGAAGFWVENGEIQYAFDEATLAGNLSDMYRNIRAIGNDVDKRGKILTGSILVDNITVAGS